MSGCDAFVFVPDFLPQKIALTCALQCV